MATQLLLLFFLSISCSALTFVTAGEATGFVGSPSKFSKNKEKISHFRFYWHDVVSGSNPTSVSVTPPVPKYNTTTGFGRVRIIDNALTAGPEPSSTVVGRAEGLYAFASQTQLDLVMVMNFALTQGKFNGSTITIVGRNVLLNKVRELSVVGGSGVFRFARGYAEARSHFVDVKSGDSTIEYNVYVSHY